MRCSDGSTRTSCTTSTRAWTGVSVHYLDNENGFKDLDAYTFYAAYHQGRFPERWRHEVVFDRRPFGGDVSGVL